MLIGTVYPASDSLTCIEQSSDDDENQKAEKESQYKTVGAPKGHKQEPQRARGQRRDEGAKARGQKKEEPKTNKNRLKDFNSFKASMKEDNRAGDSECWVDSAPKPAAREENEDEEENEERQDSNRGKPPTRGQQANRGRGRGRGRGGMPGKSVYQMTPEEIEKRDKLKKGRAIQNKKKGGHHDQKSKALKKFA